MKKNTQRFAVACAAMFLLAPSVSFGYFTTAQNAVKVNDNTVLFLIKYRFGIEKQALEMPAGAVRATAQDAHKSYISYEILNNGETSDIGTSAAFVLSTAPLQETHYTLKENESADFILFALLTLTDEEVTLNPDVALQVTGLPFTRIKDGEEYSSQLNPSELEGKYVTPVVDL